MCPSFALDPSKAMIRLSFAGMYVRGHFCETADQQSIQFKTEQTGGHVSVYIQYIYVTKFVKTFLLGTFYSVLLLDITD